MKLRLGKERIRISKKEENSKRANDGNGGSSGVKRLLELECWKEPDRGDKRWCSESEGHETHIKEMQLLMIIKVKGMIAALSGLRERLENIAEEEDFKALSDQSTVH